MPSKRPEDRLRDIIANCDHIAHYVTGMTLQTFVTDQRTVNAVQYCLLRISEAAAKLGNDLDARYPDTPWRGTRGIGNILRHRYDDVIEALVWECVQHDLPKLRASAEVELRRLASA